MVRSLAVLVFIGGVGAAAVYVAQRPTLARGDVIAADLLEANHGKLRAVECDPEIAVGADGARFTCRAEFQSGAIERLRFKMSRTGAISQTGVEAHEKSEEPAEESPRKINSSDPWGD